MKNLLLIIIVFQFLISCSEKQDLPVSDYIFENGALIVNEGNFLSANGSLSFYSYDSAMIYNDLFYNINGRPLGDVPNSIIDYSDKLYITVNNSGKIEVIDKNTLESQGTIAGLISPRTMAIINVHKAYVTSIYSDSVAIISLNNNTISGYINIKKSSESIIVAGTVAYISSWMNGNKIMVINTLNDSVIDSIEVGVEPESMVLDRNNMLWVLCNGGWQRQNSGEMDVINTVTNNVEKRYQFPTIQNSPTCLQIDDAGQTIFYLDKGVRKMDISSTNLPETPLIPESESYFYKIGINPLNNDIFITDAVDFMQRGYLLIYNSDGVFISKQRADIIPGSMCFN